MFIVQLEIDKADCVAGGPFCWEFLRETQELFGEIDLHFVLLPGAPGPQGPARLPGDLYISFEWCFRNTEGAKNPSVFSELKGNGCENSSLFFFQLETRTHWRHSIGLEQ